jgi:hypothetical protein
VDGASRERGHPTVVEAGPWLAAGAGQAIRQSLQSALHGADAHVHLGDAADRRRFDRSPPIENRKRPESRNNNFGFRLARGSAP